MELTSLDYKFLEPLALETFRNLTQTNMGSLVAESTIGRKFLVDMLFEQVSTDILEQAPVGADIQQEIEAAKQELVKAGTEALGGKGSKTLKGAIKGADKAAVTTDKNKANFFVRMWDRFKSFFTGDSRLSRFFTAAKSAIKKHWKIAAVVFGMSVVVGIVVLMVKHKKSVDRPFLKKTSNYVWNAIKWPFAKINLGVTWLINRIKKLFGKKGVVESALDKSLTFPELQFLAESLVLEANEQGEGKKGIARRAAQFVTRWAKNVGWEAPKTVVTKAIAQTLKKFDLADVAKCKETAADLIDVHSQRLDQLKKMKEKLSDKDKNALKNIDKQIKTTKSIIRRLKLVKWTNVLTVVFMVCVVAALVAIAYYAIKKVRAR